MLLDFDGTGTVKTKDLCEAFKGTGIPKSDITEFINKSDKETRGVLDLAELTAVLNNVRRRTTQTHIDSKGI